MNIHGSLVMAVYIISRDGAGDGSGLIIKSSFNCILLHYNDVTKLARRLCVCVCPMYNVHVGEEGVVVCVCVWRTRWDIRHRCVI